MARHSLWNDDYWLLLLQAFLQQPVGVKPVYHRALVELGLELHIPPQELQRRMTQLQQLATPRLERIWNTYGNRPAQLRRMVQLLRQMHGFGNAEGFYEGVVLQETFEHDFRPIDGASDLTPAMLVVVLALYYQLTPSTMVAQTPEVQATARRLRLTPQRVLEVLAGFRLCDPFHPNTGDSELGKVCQEVWERYPLEHLDELNAYDEALKDYAF